MSSPDDEFGGFDLRKKTMTQIVERMTPANRDLMLRQAEEHVRQCRDVLGRNPTTRQVATEAYLYGFFYGLRQGGEQKKHPALVLPRDLKQ